MRGKNSPSGSRKTACNLNATLEKKRGMPRFFSSIVWLRLLRQSAPSAFSVVKRFDFRSRYNVIAIDVDAAKVFTNARCASNAGFSARERAVAIGIRLLKFAGRRNCMRANAQRREKNDCFHRRSFHCEALGRL